MNLIEQKNRIVQLYQNDKHSIRAIASILNCSTSGIKRILNKYNVPMRNKCASLNLCPDEFTKEEFDIVVGTVLGDGHLTNPKKDGESQLSLGHSVKQREYITYKYNVLSRWIGCKLYSLKHHINDKTYETLNFVTRRNEKFTELKNIFYYNKIKVFPYDFVNNHLNDLSLAIWMMDDGYNYGNRGFEFCTDNFTEDENEKIVELFKNKFDINSHVIRVAKKNYRVLVNKKDKTKLFNIVRKYIIPSMLYKIKSPETIRQTLKCNFNEDIVRATGKLVEIS